ncbi:hypothetical protein GCM10009091_19030 [Pseudomonas brenneri]|nr:hypothetical protein GCM10009091_19030 [Pseudomonas brenneri]
MQAALAWQHQVKDDDLGLECEKGRQGLIPAIHGRHLETVLGQEVRNQACELLIILNEQYPAKTQVFHKLPLYEH